MTVAAAFCSLRVGSDWSGLNSICPTVSFEVENAGDVVVLQPDCTWSRRCSRATTAEQVGPSQCSSNPPRAFSTTSEAGVNAVVVMECMSLQDGHCISTTSNACILLPMQSPHSSLPHGVVTGQSTILCQIAHWKSVSWRFDEGGRKRERESASVTFQLFGAFLLIPLAIPFILSVLGLPRFSGSFFFLLPRCSGELIVHTSQPAECVDQMCATMPLSAPLSRLAVLWQLWQ